MHSPKPSESAVLELDGELLEASGFETEQPEAGFESDAQAETEGLVR